MLFRQEGKKSSNIKGTKDHEGRLGNINGLCGGVRGRGSIAGMEGRREKEDELWQRIELRSWGLSIQVLFNKIPINRQCEEPGERSS